MARRVYVLALASGSVATNATVGHNSSLSWDRDSRLVYQDPSNKIVGIELSLSALHPESSTFFKYDSISQNGREPLAVEPNTHIVSHRKWVYFLQTNESNIVEYRFEDRDYSLYNTRVIYTGWRDLPSKPDYCSTIIPRCLTIVTTERDTHQSHASNSRPHRWENELVTNPDNETYFTPSSRLVSFFDISLPRLSNRESPSNNRPTASSFSFP